MVINVKNSPKYEYFDDLATGTIFAKDPNGSPCIKTGDGNFVYLDSGMEIFLKGIPSETFFINGKVIVYSGVKLSLEY